MHCDYFTCDSIRLLFSVQTPEQRSCSNFPQRVSRRFIAIGTSSLFRWFLDHKRENKLCLPEALCTLVNYLIYMVSYFVEIDIKQPLEKKPRNPTKYTFSDNVRVEILDDGLMDYLNVAPSERHSKTTRLTVTTMTLPVVLDKLRAIGYRTVSSTNEKWTMTRDTYEPIPKVT